MLERHQFAPQPGQTKYWIRAPLRSIGVPVSCRTCVTSKCGLACSSLQGEQRRSESIFMPIFLLSQRSFRKHRTSTLQRTLAPRMQQGLDDRAAVTCCRPVNAFFAPHQSYPTVPRLLIAGRSAVPCIALQTRMPASRASSASKNSMPMFVLSGEATCHFVDTVSLPERVASQTGEKHALVVRLWPMISRSGLVKRSPLSRKFKRLLGSRTSKICASTQTMRKT